MLRRGPTAITLGESDLLDFKVRSERRLAEERENRNHKHKNRSTDTQDGPRFNTRGQKERRSQEADRAIVEPFIRPSNTQAVPLENSDVTSTVHIEEQTESLSLIDPFSDSGEETTTLDDTAHDMYLRSSPRNTGLGVAVAPSPSKNDDFHYGGFVESPIDNHRRTTSSSFGKFQLLEQKPANAFQLPKTRPHLNMNHSQESDLENVCLALLYTYPRMPQAPQNGAQLPVSLLV
jgi:hypothetical protein